jgi:osmotically-inducible protein OsmY
MKHAKGLITALGALAFLSACSPQQRAELNQATTGTTAEMREGARQAATSAERVIDDASITASVKSKLLADAQVRGLAIDVDTERGEVTLTGTARTQAERAKAEAIARQVDGVRSVVNGIKVGEGA